VDLGAARVKAKELLARAKRPVMRISPYLCGEAIDAFLDAASKKGIPVRAAGLEKVDPRWAELANGKAAGCVDGEHPVIVLAGDIAGTNNVAFTEAYRRRRAGLAELWIAGHDDETSRRAASRLLSDLPTALNEALAANPAVEVWVNAEEAGQGVLDALLAVRDRVRADVPGGFRVNVLWNSRNAGYIFSRQTAAAAKPDLLLDVGVQEGVNGTKRIAWGTKPGSEDLFVSLPRDAWIMGRSHPTGMPTRSDGKVSLDMLKPLLLIE
jgi:hypothetical protein